MVEEYQGEIFTGLGVAKERVTQNIDLYRQTCHMDLVPGTLNVRLTKDFTIPENHIYIGAKKIKPVEKKRGVTLVPARLNQEKVIVILPEKSGYGKDIIEIMAPFNIREKFGLKDGNVVTIAV